jgi:dTDP-4-dehydrorhamnose reductase
MRGPILITGAGGRLGRILARAEGAIGLTRAELDLLRPEEIAAALTRTAPACVINAAALSDADACAKDPAAAARANSQAPTLLAQACARAHLPLIHLSTDYVFGGDDLDRPRRETDPPKPINVYGASKLAGERAVLAASAAHMCVRVAWLFGFEGDFIDRMARQAISAGHLRLTDQAGTPTPAGPLAQALITLAHRRGQGAALPPLLHIAGAPPTDRATWIETALADAPNVPITRVPLSEFPDAAHRPRGTPLDCTLYQTLVGAPPDWRTPARAWGAARLQFHRAATSHC